MRLCAVKDRIPQDADTWFWGSDLFDQMGRFAGLGDEMATIALDSLADYPVLQAETATLATIRQLIDVRTGEGVQDDLWHTRTIIERYTPQLVPAMRGAREQRGKITFGPVNALHYPLALVAMTLLPALAWFGWRGRLPFAIAELAATCMVAILGNAFICGALSNPHDRYGARMVWIAAFVGLVALAVVAVQRAPRLAGLMRDRQSAVPAAIPVETTIR